MVWIVRGNLATEDPLASDEGMQPGPLNFHLDLSDLEVLPKAPCQLVAMVELVTSIKDLEKEPY